MINSYFKFASCAILFALAFTPTLTDLFARWTIIGENQAHGLFILALFLYLFTNKLKYLPTAIISLKWLGTLLLALCSLTWFVAAALSIETIEQLILLPTIFFLSWSLLGLHPAMILASTIALLITAVPVWDFLTPFLVDLSSQVVGALVRASRIAALIDGNSIYLPYGRIDIADGCSGIRYLTIAIALASYLALTSNAKLQTKSMLIIFSVFLGLFANWLRIYIIIMVAHFTDMQAELVRHHESFGWYLFLIVCIPFWFFARIIPNQEHRESTSHSGPPNSTSVIVTSFIALFLGPSIYWVASPAYTSPTIRNADQWGYQLHSLTDITSPYRLPASKLHLHKRQADITTEIAINWKKENHEDLVPYNVNSLNRELWTITSENTASIEEYSAKLTLYTRKFSQEYACTLSWYQVGKSKTGNYYTAKLLQIPAMLKRDNLFSAVAVTISSNQPNCKHHQDVLIAAASKVNNEVEQMITY